MKELDIFTTLVALCVLAITAYFIFEPFLSGDYAAADNPSALCQEAYNDSTLVGRNNCMLTCQVICSRVRSADGYESEIDIGILHKRK